MKTTSAKNPRENKRHGNQFSYLLDSIDVSGYDQIQQPTNDRETINAFFEVYNLEYNDLYNKRIYPNEVGRLEQYLRGLPSSICIAYDNYIISRLLESWGVKPTEYNVGSYWHCCAFRLLQLRDILNK